MATTAIFGAHGRDVTAAEAAELAPAPAPLSPGKPTTFHDVLEALNPLQYLPVIGTIYRVATGDEGSPALRTAGSLIGGMLMGGPVGLLTSIAGQLAEHFLHLEHLARSIVAPASAPTSDPKLPTVPVPVTAPAATNASPAASASHVAPAPAPIAPVAAPVAAQVVAAYARAADLGRVVPGGRES